MENFKSKYIKYKSKYQQLKQLQTGGFNLDDIKPSFDSGNGDKKVKRNLALYEIMTLEGSNKQNWNFVKQFWDENVVVISFDGNIIKGRDQQLNNMKMMYTFAPDTKIISTELQFGSGDWIAVANTMTGTFMNPIQLPGGILIQPTGKKFIMKSCILMRWINDKIVEFRVFWDQKSFEEQLGICQCNNK